MMSSTIFARLHAAARHKRNSLCRQ